jgi:hypothetical protein
MTLSFDASQGRMQAHSIARWVTQRAAIGAWSETSSATVAANRQLTARTSMLTLRDILKPGITGGLRSSTHELIPLGQAELRAFRTWCHTMARRLGAEVTHERPAEYATNYHAIDVMRREDGAEFEFMMHAFLPYLGARSVSAKPGELIYVDVPGMNGDPAPPLVVLPATLLNSWITRELWM